jgi:hypothetical protein
MLQDEEQANRLGELEAKEKRLEAEKKAIAKEIKGHLVSVLYWSPWPPWPPWISVDSYPTRLLHRRRR